MSHFPSLLAIFPAIALATLCQYVPCESTGPVSFASLLDAANGHLELVETARGSIALWEEEPKLGKQRIEAKGPWFYSAGEWRLDAHGSLPVAESSPTKSESNLNWDRSQKQQKFQQKGDSVLQFFPSWQSAVVVPHQSAPLLGLALYGVDPKFTGLARLAELESLGQVIDFKVTTVPGPPEALKIEYTLAMDSSRTPVAKGEVHVVPSMQYSLVFMAGAMLSGDGGASGVSTTMALEPVSQVWFPAKVQWFRTATSDWSGDRTVYKEYTFSEVQINVPVSRDDLDIIMPEDTQVSNTFTQQAYRLSQPATLEDLLSGKIRADSRPIEEQNQDGRAASAATSGPSSKRNSAIALWAIATCAAAVVLYLAAIALIRNRANAVNGE